MLIPTVIEQTKPRRARVRHLLPALEGAGGLLREPARRFRREPRDAQLLHSRPRTPPGDPALHQLPRREMTGLFAITTRCSSSAADQHDLCRAGRVGGCVCCSRRARWAAHGVPNARVLIHQPHGGAQGQTTDVELARRRRWCSCAPHDRDPRRAHGARPSRGSGPTSSATTSCAVRGGGVRDDSRVITRRARSCTGVGACRELGVERLSRTRECQPDVAWALVRPPSVDSLAGRSPTSGAAAPVARRRSARCDRERATPMVRAPSPRRHAPALLRPVINATGVLLHTNLGRGTPRLRASGGVHEPRARGGDRSSRLPTRSCGCIARRGPVGPSRRSS